MKIRPLNAASLSELSNRIAVPTYHRSNIRAGIVHVGVGGFHRAHQANYLDQLLEHHGVNDWGVCGVGLRTGDEAMAKALHDQDYLYTLTVRHPDGQTENRVIGSILDFLLSTDDPAAVIDCMAHPDTKIVSLTITEGGYNFNAAGDFNFDNPQVQEEIANPHKPLTIFGFLTAALRKRRAAGIAPFTVLSCDNIQHNGQVARQMVLAFAERQDEELADWIREQVSFPNTMVDRITPVTTPADITYLQKEVGVMDAWPVVCEPFTQWVIEDKFVNGRPPLELVGVRFVPDVSPYEKMKIRLLNAGHSVLGIPGALHGHSTINACMEDDVFVRFMRAFMDLEVTPVLDPVEGVDLKEYKDTLEERFANPNIKDSVSRICSESSAKLPKFLVPTLRENLDSGGSIDHATLVLAAWAVYSARRTTEKGEPLEIIDAQADQLHNAAAGPASDPLSFLRQPDLFDELVTEKRFTERYAVFMKRLSAGEKIRELMEEVMG